MALKSMRREHDQLSNHDIPTIASTITITIFIPFVIARPICRRNLWTVALMKIDRKWRRTVKPWMKSYTLWMLDRGERLSLAWKCHFSLVVTVRPSGSALWEPIRPTIYIQPGWLSDITSITYGNGINWSKNHDRVLKRWQLNFFEN